MMTAYATRDQIVWNEGHHAGLSRATRKDNPYRPGSADWRAWVSGFDAAFEFA